MTFSGLESSVWAFASAVAMAATLSLDRCMADLHVHEVEADSTRLGAFGTDAVAQALGHGRAITLCGGLERVVAIIKPAHPQPAVLSIFSNCRRVATR